MDPNKMKFAAIGGVVAGVASSIPIVSMLNLCCCAWALGGGFLATFLYNKSQGSRGVTPAEGATLGALAGAIGAPIYFVINTILTIALGPLTAEMLKSFGVDVPGGGGGGVGSAIFGSLMGMVVLAIFTTLGGLIASLIFKPTGGAPPSYPGVGSGPGAPFGQPGGTPYGQQGGNPYGQGGSDPYGGGGQGGTGGTGGTGY